MDDDVETRERIFHHIVRDYILGLLLFIMLYVASYAAICAFRRRPERDDCCADDAGDALVYRISLWLCTFSLAVSAGAVLLLPISILANEALLMFPNSYYLQWINTSLLHGVWNSIFLCSNTSVFVLLPFAYFFTESEGLPGSKRGIKSRMIEASIVLSLLAVLVCGLVIIFSALLDNDNFSRIILFDMWTFYLPYLYSLMSLIGVLMLLICTPIGFVRLFTVMGQLITKPQFLHNIEEELQVMHLEEASVYRLLYPYAHSLDSNGSPFRSGQSQSTGLFKCSEVSTMCETQCKPSLSASSSSLPSLRVSDMADYSRNSADAQDLYKQQLILSHGGNGFYSHSESRETKADSSKNSKSNGSWFVGGAQSGLRPSSSYSDLHIASKLSNGSVVHGDAAMSKFSGRIRSARDRSVTDISNNEKYLRDEYQLPHQSVNNWRTNGKHSSQVKDFRANGNPSSGVYDWHTNDDTRVNGSTQKQSYLGSSTDDGLRAKLEEIKKNRYSLEKKQSISSLRRNLGYPLAMLLLLALMCVTVLLVVLNVVELLTGLKALPVGSKELVLGITSLSALGTIGAVLEITIILYLMLTSLVGFYSVPLLRRLLPRWHDTPITSIIGNCVVLVILSSALPVLSRTLGITNFDLLGSFGRLRWLGNLYIILSYNGAFAVATVVCIVTKFTATIRRALMNKFEEVYVQGRARLERPGFLTSFFSSRRARQHSNKKHE